MRVGLVRWLLPILAACSAADAPVAVHATPPEIRGPASLERGTVPLYGGTLAASEDYVVVADPGHDIVHVVDLDRSGPPVAVPLPEGSEPFRVALDGPTAFVSLRGSGAIAALDLAGAEWIASTEVCAEPRGVDVADDEVFVACASGEVVVLDPRLEVLRMAQIADDLRDIVIEGERAWLSRFRSAKVGRIDPQTLEVDFWRRPRFIGEERQARVAWRMRAHPDGGVLVLHQGAILRPIVLDLEVPVDPDIPTPSAYGGDGEGCRARRGPSTTHLSHVTVLGDVRTGGALMTPGPRYDFVLADRTAIFADGQPAPNPAATTSLHLADALAGTSCAVDRRSFTPSSAVVTAVGYTRDELWWFARDGARLVGGTGDRSLSGGAYEEGAFALFHEVRSAGIACASCHPEGQDDGHVWHFVDLGPRRTQNIAGGVAERAPFHWDGEFATLDELMDDVFVGRMGGEAVDGAGVDDLAAWMHEIPSLRSRPSDDALVAEGRDLFLGDAACAACHAGAQYTDAQLHVVREGEPPLKTPSLLGVGARAPYMHDGCAITLAQRFTDPACGGGDRHGTTSALSPGDVDALVAFLKSL